MAEQPDWGTCRVVKLGYSRDPWRIVTTDGHEVSAWRPYPGHPDGKTELPPFLMPLCFPRKRDAIAALNERLTAALDTEATRA